MFKTLVELGFKLAFMWNQSSHWLYFLGLKTVIHALKTSCLLTNFTCLDKGKCIQPLETEKGKNYHNRIQKYNNDLKYFH